MKKIDELESELLQICESSPEAARFQYMVECRLSHCKTFEEKSQCLLDLLQENLKELNQEFNKLEKALEKLKTI